MEREVQELAKSREAGRVRFEARLAARREHIEGLIAANQANRSRVEDAFLDFLDAQLLPSSPQEVTAGRESSSEPYVFSDEEGEEGPIQAQTRLESGPEGANSLVDENGNLREDWARPTQAGLPTG